MGDVDGVTKVARGGMELARFAPERKLAAWKNQLVSQRKGSNAISRITTIQADKLRFMKALTFSCRLPARRCHPNESSAAKFASLVGLGTFNFPKATRHIAGRTCAKNAVQIQSSAGPVFVHLFFTGTFGICAQTNRRIAFLILLFVVSRL